MEIINHFIEGIVEILPESYQDDRGEFFESYNEKQLEQAGFNWKFVQDNQSFSKKGVLRGLHFQYPPHEQGKLVRVISGRVLDVAVDLRINSETFGQHISVILDSVSKNMFFIPKGFAHGFLALEDTIFFYKCTGFYHRESESGIVWNDKTLNINWGMENPFLSSKDLFLPSFQAIVKILEKSGK